MFIADINAKNDDICQMLIGNFEKISKGNDDNLEDELKNIPK